MDELSRIRSLHNNEIHLISDTPLTATKLVVGREYWGFRIDTSTRFEPGRGLVRTIVDPPHVIENNQSSTYSINAQNLPGTTRFYGRYESLDYRNRDDYFLVFNNNGERVIADGFHTLFFEAPPSATEGGAKRRRRRTNTKTKRRNSKSSRRNSKRRNTKK